MAAKIISQKKFAKLVASTGVLSQPPGALTRLSNLLFTQRGSLQVADGSLPIATLAAPYLIPLTLNVFNSGKPGIFPIYLALARGNTPSMGEFVTYTFAVSGGTTPGVALFNFALVGFDIAGAIHNSPVFGRITSRYTDDTTATATFVVPAGVLLVKLYLVSPDQTIWYYLGSSATSPIAAAIVLTAPTSPLAGNDSFSSALELSTVDPVTGAITFAAVGTPYAGPVIAAVSVAPGGPNFNPAQPYPGYSPYGGVAGVIEPIPQMIQFAGQEILILGNGVTPQAVDPTAATPTPVPLTNTFTAAYPTWQASVSWITGALVTDGANYYTATQGGVSGTTTPSWNTAQGSLTSDGSVIWTSNGPIPVSIAPVGAAHAVAYAGSLWLANTSPTTTDIDGPSCLKMSDSNNPNSWNPVNTAFISRQDGTQITGLCSFTIAALGISPTGSLCVFKEFTTYQVIGVFGSTTFEIQPAQTNLGCIAARSIQFLPGFGVVRFTHLGFAVFDGINDRLISEDIRPYLFAGVDSEGDLTPVDPGYIYRSQSAQTTSPPMYLCAMPLVGAAGQLTRLFCYDLVMKAWAVIDLPWTISTMGAMAAGEGYPLVLAGRNDGTIQRLQSGDAYWDQGAVDQTPVQWFFRTPDIFGEGQTQRLFYEQATITGYGSVAMVQSILASLWLDGTNLGQQAINVVPQGDSMFVARVSIFRSGQRAHLDISGTNGGAPGVIDSVDWAVVPKSPLAIRVIS